ncbi:LysR substrate-binding domain-containing protein [Rhizobium sp. G187]|uniref:LysR substrate-binding domain-containing protein n=1 Tax=Rhizobium sp. G187 TaxID=3451352 RepID=UPI003EE5074E
MIDALPFAALRTFEAVVRLKGFVRAAEELGVTQGAVSQQVKVLEEWLGRRLLDRGPSGVRPLPDGARLAQAVADSFNGIAGICDDIRQAEGPNLTIGLSCPPGFAYLWLIPRLINFDQKFPDYQVSVLTSSTPEDLLGSDADIAIRYGSAGVPGYETELLLNECVFPVCSPDLLLQKPIRDVADLGNHTLLLDSLSKERNSVAPTWEFWAGELGEVLPPPLRTRRFGLSNMVVQAAIQGLGVALGREPLVIDALIQGQLVRPFPQLVPSQHSYWIVSRRGASMRSARVRAMRDWLLEEAAAQLHLTQIGPCIGE